MPFVKPSGHSNKARLLKPATVIASLLFVLLVAIAIGQLAGCQQHETTTIGVAVTSLSWEPRSPKVAQPVVFRAILRNRTPDTIPSGTPIRLNFGVDGNLASWADIVTPVMKPGSAVTVTADHAPNTDGTWIATAGRHFVVASANITPTNGAVVHSLIRRSALLAVRPVPKSTNIRIMPLGDSITSGNHSSTSYRYYLWKHLTADGFHDIAFVGSLHGITDGFPPVDDDWDEDHEGQSGWRADEIVDGRENGQDELNGKLGGKAGWANIYHPDIVLIDLGANDLEQGRTPEVALAAVERVVQVLRTENPNIGIALAELSPDSDANADALLKFNELIIKYAVDSSTIESPIIPVDLYSSIDRASDTVDGIHLTDKGNAKMAEAWYPAVVKLIKQVEARPKGPAAEVDEIDSLDE